MKKLLLVALLAIGVSATTFAQGGGRRSPEEQVAALKTSLTLTDAQSAKILAILTAQTKSQDSLRTAGADRTAITALRTANQAKIKAVLTADQATAYQKQLDEQRARFQGGQGGGAPRN